MARFCGVGGRRVAGGFKLEAAAQHRLLDIPPKQCAVGRMGHSYLGLCAVGFAVLLGRDERPGSFKDRGLKAPRCRARRWRIPT